MTGGIISVNFYLVTAPALSTLALGRIINSCTKGHYANYFCGEFFKSWYYVSA